MGLHAAPRDNMRGLLFPRTSLGKNSDANIFTLSKFYFFKHSKNQNSSLLFVILDATWSLYFWKKLNVSTYRIDSRKYVLYFYNWKKNILRCRLIHRRIDGIHYSGATVSFLGQAHRFLCSAAFYMGTLMF